jgi:dihydrolipoamide dehydrogenase
VKDFDVVVLGGGPGGYVAAIRAAQLGLSTALVEKRPTLGGTCLNVGCIPSKALLDSSELFARIRDEADLHGISVSDPRMDVRKMQARKDAVVKKLTGGVSTLMKANEITVYHGTGWVTGPGTVEIRTDVTDATHSDSGGSGDGSGNASRKGSIPAHPPSAQSPPAQNSPVRGPESTGDTIHGKNLLLATGSEPVHLPFLPCDGKVVVDSTGALAFDAVPEHLVIVGGGVIGLELGSVWRRLGARVTVVELLPHIMAGWDTQLSRTMKRELEKQGFEFLLETAVKGLTVKKGKAYLAATDASGKDVEIIGDRVLVAVGRRPRLEGSNIESLGLEMDNGRIRVDHTFATSVPGVWAVGDIVAGPMLAHKAEDEGIAAAERIAGKAGHVNYGTIPNVIYTWPEAASAGATEDELKSTGVSYRSGVFPFAANGRALAMGSTAGSVRILADAVTDTVLGAHVIGPWASDLIGEIVSVMEFHGSAEDIARTVHAHPTLSEAVKEAALGVDGRMIHGKN